VLGYIVERHIEAKMTDETKPLLLDIQSDLGSMISKASPLMERADDDVIDLEPSQPLRYDKNNTWISQWATLHYYSPHPYGFP
jgi:hypothetical protein